MDGAGEDFDFDGDPRQRSPKLTSRGGPAEAAGVATEAMVVGIFPRGCQVVLGGELVDADLSPAIRLDDENDLAVGDNVQIRDDPGRKVVTAILPRTTVLSRPDPLLRHRERVIAANVDVVVHVASVIAPPLRPGLIDRYLVAIAYGGAAPMIVVNKIDLALPGEHRDLELEALAVYRELGVPVVPCSTHTGEGTEEIRQRLAGRTAVFVGHSGVGKSSLIRGLEPKLILRIGAVRTRGTGRHTTTRSTLYDLGNGTRVIDTPGIREFGLWQVDSRELRFYFPELESAALHCRFNDCLHVEEPECAVKSAVEAGEIRPERYATYVKLLEELRTEET